MKKLLIAAALSASALGCSSNNTSCVARGTKVLTPDGWRPIEDLAVDDIVFAFDERTGERFATPVTAIKRATREVGAVEIAGTELRMTTDHPVYCPRDEMYAPAGDWFLGKRTHLAMLSDDGFTNTKVTWSKTFVEVTEVFDITVEHELHNFVANGVLVHNKSPACAEDPCECPDGSIGTGTCEGGCRSCGNSPDMFVTPNNTTDMSMPSDASTPDLGTDTGSESDIGVDMGTPRHRGSCMTNADCARPTWSCITIPANDPNGYHTCQPADALEPGCATIEAPDTCCLHTDCNQTDPSGTCIIGPIFYCGGVAPVIANICVTDECATDGDCGAGEICLPPRVLAEPVARCVATECLLDSDCDSRAGGQCTEFFDPCNRRFAGFSCTYDDSVCRTSTDCPPETPVCSPGADGATTCVEFNAPP